MGALLEAAVSAPPTSIALNLAKDIHWIRVSTINNNISYCLMIFVILWNAIFISLHTVILLVVLRLVEILCDHKNV